MISIIIPTLNEEKLLPKLLKSIKNQKFKDYEVIVSDAASTDKTTDIAKKYGCRLTKGGRPAIARNNGAKIAKGDIFLFLDSDVILPKDFLEKSIKEFKERKLGSATVSIIPLTNRTIDKIMYWSYNLWQKVIQYTDPHAAGVCIFTTKDVFNKVKGFDSTITFCEDHAYVKKTKKFGKFRVLNDAIVYNSIRRLYSEGRVKLTLKMLFTFFYRTFIGEIRHKFKKFIWSPEDSIRNK